MEMADEMTSDSASRVTRSSRDLRRLLLAAVACAAGMTVLRAQDVPPATPPTSAQPAPAAEGGAGSKAVLEVRTLEVPFILDDGQAIARLVYEELAERPSKLYGHSIASHYQGQGLKLSKHFK